MLKSFLKGGDAECYQGVTVQYVPGRSAVLTVTSDDASDDTSIDGTGESSSSGSSNQPQQYALTQYQSLDELHFLFATTIGFALKSNEDCAAIREASLDRERDERQAKHRIHEYYRWREIYVEAFRHDVIGQQQQQQQETSEDDDHRNRRRHEQILQQQQQLDQQHAHHPYQRQRQRQRRLPTQSRPGGAEPDILVDNYDIINQKHATFVPERHQYAERYLLEHCS